MTTPDQFGTPPQVVRASRPQLAVVTWSVIALCLAVWAAQEMIPGFTDTVVLSPREGRSEPWRFITSAFAHSLGFTHIGMNMLALYSLGRQLEFVLGRGRFAVVYLVCALGGSVGFVAMASSMTSWYGVVGASGAVFGLFGVYVVLLRRSGGSLRPVLGLLLLNAALPVFFPQIAWQAHVGGFLTGIVAGWLLVRDATRRAAGRRGGFWPSMAVLTVLLVLLAVVRYAMA